MKKFKAHLDDFTWEFSWKEIAIFKMCMMAFGVVVGLQIPACKKKPIAILGIATFFGTTALLLDKLVCSFGSFSPEDDEDAKDDGFVMHITLGDKDD